MSEDVNLEHMLDVFISIDVNSASVWCACISFMRHLSWHKPRLVVLGPKVEGLPDNHPSKPECLFQLAELFGSVGNRMEGKRLLTHGLKLWGGQGNNLWVAQALYSISDANRLLGLWKEGIPQAEEAMENFKQFNHIHGQAKSWQLLALLFQADDQLDAAEQAASQAINLLQDKGEEFGVCQCYRILGDIYHSRNEIEKAISHFETALRIGSSFNLSYHLFWSHHSLAQLFSEQGRFNDAHAHIECAKPHAINDTYLLGHVTELQAVCWYKECKFKEAKSAALYAADIYERSGATKDLEYCRATLQKIEMGLGSSCKFPDTVLLPIPINSPFPATHSTSTRHNFTSRFRHILPHPPRSVPR